MVQILPLVGVAALFTQSALAAAVPARRSYGSSSNYGSSNYNSGNNNAYQQSSNQESNQHASNPYDSGSNQYNNYESSSSLEEALATSTAAYMAMDTAYANSNNYNQYTSSSSSWDLAAAEATSTSTYNWDTSIAAAEATSTGYNNYYTSSTDAAQATYTYSMPSYGSGSSNWNSGYNNCVQQCMVQYGAPPSSNSTDSQASLPESTGTGAIHTIMVAPSGAGLRYMPFALNASIGDTLRYVWTTDSNHTVTLSSALAICNKSAQAAQLGFASGVRNASAGVQTFDVTVQTSDPQFYYCGVADHCEKGMFGMINPSNNLGAPNTVGTMMSSLMQSYPQLQAAYNYMMQNVSGTSAQNWGMGMSLQGIPESQYEDVAANVLFTQANFAANPGMLESNQGAYNPDGSPVQIVSALNTLLSNGTDTPISSASDASTSTQSAPAAYGTSTVSPANATSGALSTRSVGTWVAALVGVAGWLLI